MAWTARFIAQRYRVRLLFRKRVHFEDNSHANRAPISRLLDTVKVINCAC